MSTEHLITIVCALRYVAARDTSAASLVCDYIAECFPHLSQSRKIDLALQIVMALTENQETPNTALKLVLDDLWTSIKEAATSDDEIRTIYEHIAQQSACDRNCIALRRLTLPARPTGA